MRLTEHQKKSIIENLKIVFGERAKVYLFGSRVDDSKRGGDIDLLIECEPCYNTFANVIKFLTKLQNNIGQQKIDVVVKNVLENDERLIVREALSKGILLS